jgi:hypothetical protein
LFDRPGIQVVDQQAHANAAARGVAQLAQKQCADLVVADQVVLRVDRALGAARDRDARIECSLALGQQPERGVARLARTQHAARHLSQRRVGRWRERLRGWAGFMRGQRRTTRRQRQQRGDKQR